MGFFLELAEETIPTYDPVALVAVGHVGRSVVDHMLMYQLPVSAHQFVGSSYANTSLSSPAVVIVVHPTHANAAELRELRDITAHARANGSLVFSIATRLAPIASVSPENGDAVRSQLRPDAWLSLPSSETLSRLLKDNCPAKASQQMLKSTCQLIANLLQTIRSQGLVTAGADEVRAMFAQPSLAHLSSGAATGPDRAKRAAIEAIGTMKLHNLTSVLFSLRASPDLKLREVDEIASLLRESLRESVEMHWSAQLDEAMQDEIRLTLIGAGQAKNATQICGRRSSKSHQKNERTERNQPLRRCSARRPKSRVNMLKVNRFS
jgi:hypothetical protein